MMKYHIFSFVIVIFSISMGFSQDPVEPRDYEDLYVVDGVVIDGDTMPVITLRTADIFSYRKNRSKRYQRKFDKLKRNVIKTYPYARVAGELIGEYEQELAEMESDSEKKYFIKKAEESLKEEFEGDLRDMTISQGHVLIKLIDRETGNTSYDLIKELKGGFSAFLWQSVARIFGSDLKDNYNPAENETDNMIEQIVMQIEAGNILVEKREAKTPEANRMLDRRKKRLEKKLEREKKREARKKG